MFETAVVNVRGRSARQRSGLFVFSVAAHTVVGVGLVLAGIQSVGFPANAPNQMELFRTAPPLPPIQLGSQQATRQPEQQAARPKPQTPAVLRTDVAPQLIPEHVTPLAGSGETSDSNLPVGDGTQVGDPNGVIGGIPPVDTKPAPPAEEPHVFTTAQVDTPPVAIKRVTPEFPAVPQRLHMSGWVLVEGVIDSTGRIREPRVVASSFGAFEKPALDAVQQWEFKPGIRHGAAVDTLFQLRVTFTLR